ncbi:HlyD family efflux transporter periplasmic adaptor subunit [Apibacter muscae]|uniref:efflux RND transporter periplasmic adaptor subunit n=1 Tax=Apibacter muscae TaxID=2509004 RepID=UPI0011ADCA84|nr:efflux RND transporter periplasmic adaptor subunit [Apibacter muscae]TWP24811.1 HlyD family efflux transporter periplasmic adaptor subunit [Apibacter muscae]
MKFIINYKIVVISCLLFLACSKRETTAPERKNLQEAVFGNGYIKQEDEYTISSTINGLITEVNIKEGDLITPQNLLVRIKSDVPNVQLQDAYVVNNDAIRNTANNSPQILQIQAQINQARQQLILDQNNYDRYKKLKQTNSVSQLDLEKAESQYIASKENLRALEESLAQIKNQLNLAVQRSKIQIENQKAQLEDYNVIGEKEGQVIEVYKKKGELVKIGDPIAKIGSGKYLIRLYISEDDITQIEVGQKLVVNLNTYPNHGFSASISKIYPGFNKDEQSYIVEAEFDKLPEKLFSGTQLQANIKVGERKNVLVIPTDYLVKGRFVTLKDGTEKAVVIGKQNKDWTEILSGITEKDIITKKK